MILRYTYMISVSKEAKLYLYQHQKKRNQDAESIFYFKMIFVQ